MSAGLPAPVNLAARQTLNLPVSFSADNTAQASGALVFNVLTDEHGASPLAQLRLDYTLSEAKAWLVPSPGYLETGLARGGSGIESFTLQNKGTAPLTDMSLGLTTADGAPAPAWVSLASANPGSIGVGESKTVDIAFAPGGEVVEGVYSLKLQVGGSGNGSGNGAQSFNIYASVTQSGVGGVLFKASDLYTATLDKNGRPIPGLAGASITLQNEAVASQVYQLTTDSLGEAFFQALPAGRYTWRAKATNHQELGGRLQVKAGLNVNEPIFLDYSLITVEWNVREVAIQDRYDVILKATFESDVPAAVVMLEPSSLNLPAMRAGEIYNGELTLTNYGLIRAEHVAQKLPADDANFRFEFLATPPASLNAKQRVTIPYRIIALKSLDPGGAASGAGCWSWSQRTDIACDYVCANGELSKACGSYTVWSSVSNSTCGSAGGGSTSGGATIYGGGGGGSGGGTPYSDAPGPPPCVNCLGEETKPACTTCGTN